MTLSLENILEGYNMSFNVNCTYYDHEGILKSCLENGV